MKAKTRRIVVDGSEYRWAIVELLWPKLVLRVWRPSETTKPWFELEVEPGHVGPGIVREHILQHAKQSLDG